MRSIEVLEKGGNVETGSNVVTSRPLHITHILAGLNRVLDYEPLLQSDRTIIRMAIAEIAHQHPEAATIPRATMLNPEGDEP